MFKIDVPGVDNESSPGHYILGEKAGDMPGENAVAYYYDWVPAEPSESADEGPSA